MTEATTKSPSKTESNAKSEGKAESKAVATVDVKENALTPLANSRFLALRPESGVAEAIRANLGEDGAVEETMLTRVKIPAGGLTKWTIETAKGEIVTESIEGILVFFGKGGVLFPSNDPKEGQLPLLRTDDWKTAYQVGEDFGDINPAELKKYEVAPGVYDWQKLPWNEFGSGRGNRGKRAKNYYTICILRDQDALPLLLRAMPGSLKNFEKFRNSLISIGMPHFRAVVSIGLESAINEAGQKYSRMTFKMTGELSKEEGDLVRKLYTEPLREAIRRLDVGDLLSDTEE
jgi:hypothetical protein